MPEERTVPGLTTTTNEDQLKRGVWRTKYKGTRGEVTLEPEQNVGVILVKLNDAVSDILALKAAAEQVPGVDEATALMFDKMPAATEAPEGDEMSLKVRIMPTLSTPRVDNIEPIDPAE